jgi:hypothetical protein
MYRDAFFFLEFLLLLLRLLLYCCLADGISCLLYLPLYYELYPRGRGQEEGKVHV